MTNNQLLLNVFLSLIEWIKVPLSKVSPNVSKQTTGRLCSCFNHVMWHCEFLTVAHLSGFVSTFHWNESKAKTFELSAQVVNLKVRVFCNNCPSMFSHLITCFCPHGITNKMISQLLQLKKIGIHVCSKVWGQFVWSLLHCQNWNIHHSFCVFVVTFTQCVTTLELFSLCTSWL